MSLLTKCLKTSGLLAGVAALSGIVAMPHAFASSHSDAPLIKLDPQANLTDVYAFIGNSANGKVLNVLVSVHPFSEPGDGVTYDKFSDDALYTINITDPTTGVTTMRYDFKFSSVNSGFKNPNTILNYGRGTAVGPITDVDGPTRNYVQTYSVFRTVGTTTTTVATGLKTPPPNVGARTTPLYNGPDGFAVSGATTNAGLDIYTRNAIGTGASGEKLFAGSREDSFFSDIPGIFDLLDPRILGSSLGQAGGGVDGFKGFNVLTYSIQIPISQLSPVSYAPVFGGAFGISPTTHGVGVYASVSRPRITLRSATGNPSSSGPYVQVNRLGNPLFNEGLVAVKDKDNYNRDVPTSDSAKYATYALNPELAVLINTVFGTTFATTGRTDLAAVYIPDVLRVSTDTDAVKLAGQSGFSRFGFIGGDTTTGTSTLSSGWPNGRRLGDDVVDIALTAIASGPTYSAITLVGDNVPENDQTYHQVFPYSATPNSGAKNRKDSL